MQRSEQLTSDTFEESSLAAPRRAKQAIDLSARQRQVQPFQHLERTQFNFQCARISGVEPYDSHVEPYDNHAQG